MIRLKLYTRKKNILLSYLFRVFYSVCSIKENLVMMKNSSRRMYTFFSYLMLTKSFRYVKLLRPLFQPLYNSLQGAHDSLMSNKDAGNKRYFYYVVELQLRIIIIVAHYSSTEMVYRKSFYIIQQNIVKTATIYTKKYILQTLNRLEQYAHRALQVQAFDSTMNKYGC